MNDLISRQAAIDAVSRGCQEFRGIFAECEKNLNELPPAQPTYTDAEIQKMQDIEQAQLEKAFELGREDAKAEAIQRWIPCSERLPDKEGNYLMTAQPTYNHAKDIRIAHWSGRWVGYVKSEILAWMPLPEPYKEENR